MTVESEGRLNAPRIDISHAAVTAESSIVATGIRVNEEATLTEKTRYS